MHIEEEVLRSFHEGTLETKELIMVLEHTQTCSYCAQLLMQIEQDEVIESPVYLKNNILERTKKIDVKVETKMKATSKRAELFIYGVKTSAAVLGALMLLVSITYMEETQSRNNQLLSSQISTQVHEKSSPIENIMSIFSSQIINGGKE